MVTWLIVEDEHDLQANFIALVEKHGINALGFTTMPVALQVLDEIDAGHFQDELPELALLDVRLMDEKGINLEGGLLLAERIRESATLSKIPVVLMTAYRLNSREEEAYLARTGAKRILYKPFSLTAAIPELRRLTNQQQR